VEGGIVLLLLRCPEGLGEESLSSDSDCHYILFIGAPKLHTMLAAHHSRRKYICNISFAEPEIEPGTP